MGFDPTGIHLGILQAREEARSESEEKMRRCNYAIPGHPAWRVLECSLTGRGCGMSLYDAPDNCTLRLHAEITRMEARLAEAERLIRQSYEFLQAFLTLRFEVTVESQMKLITLMMDLENFLAPKEEPHDN